MLNRHETARNALNAFDHTGAKLPTAVRAALDHADRIRDFITAAQGHNLPGAILAALRTGTDPANDPDVQAATIRAQWASPAVLSSLQTAAETATVAAVATNADAMFAAMRPTFDAAVKELEAAHGVLGDVDLRADHTRILAMGSTAATAWAKAITAVEQTNNITTAWGTIARVGGVREELFVAGTVAWDADRWVALHHADRHHHVGADAWAAIRNGHTLRLADRATLVAFESEVADAEQRARAAAAARDVRSVTYRGKDQFTR